MWGIIGHVTVEAGNTVETDGAPPQYKVLDLLCSFELLRKEMENEFLRFEPVTSDPKAGIIP